VIALLVGAFRVPPPSDLPARIQGDHEGRPYKMPDCLLGQPLWLPSPTVDLSARV